MPGRHKTAKRAAVSKRQLAALIEEATVDCYNESEAVCGFYTMIEDHLEVPFAAVVLGVDVEVTRVELTRQEEIVAVCMRGKQRQRIPVPPENSIRRVRRKDTAAAVDCPTVASHRARTFRSDARVRFVGLSRSRSPRVSVMQAARSPSAARRK